MNAPFLSEGASLAATLPAALIIGIAFGAALERAGLGSARKLAGQFYGRDFTVLKVMFSALLVAMLGVFWLGRLGWLDVDALYVPPTFIVPQVAGAVLFGAGLLVAGLCPGTACVSAATGRIDGVFVLLGLLVGMIMVGLLLPSFTGFYESTARGTWTLPEWLDVSPGLVVATVVVMALLTFAVSEWIENPRFRLHFSLHRALVVLALGAGGLAALVGTPQPPLARDEVSAEQLAGWIRERRSGLQLLDTRSAEAMEHDRLPGAHAVDEFDAATAASGDTIVVYAAGSLDARTVETLRQRLHVRDVLRLHGGVDAWNAQVLFPVLRNGASVRQQQEFSTRAQLSRYFGGTPRVLEPGSAPQRMQGRRGC